MHRLFTDETIISFDIETTGLAAGVNSMIELGAVAYRNGVEISSFTAALQEFEGSVRDLDTMLWWKDHRDQWDRIRKVQRDPKEVMTDFYQWVKSLPSPCTLTANPAPFDTSFLFWYLHTYCGKKAINELFNRHRALDIRTFIAAMYAVPYSQAERRLMPKSWSDGFSITHNALDDAREQGASLMHLLESCACLHESVKILLQEQDAAEAAGQ